MDDFLLLLILDRISGGEFRSVVNVVGIFIVIGGFLAHPLLGVFLLIVWGICAAVTSHMDEADRRDREARFKKQMREDEERATWRVIWEMESEVQQEARNAWEEWMRPQWQVQQEAQKEEEERRRREEWDERMRQLYAPVQVHIEAAERAERRAKEISRRVEEASRRVEEASRKAEEIAAKEAAERAKAHEERVGRARTAREVRETQKAARKAVKRAWRGIYA